MSQLVTIPFRLTNEREATLRRELNLPDTQRLTHIQAFYAIRDTVYGWLDGAAETVVLDPDPTDDLGERRGFKVSDRPVKRKLRIKKRR